jgi:hypothetical protein
MLARLKHSSLLCLTFNHKKSCKRNKRYMSAKVKGMLYIEWHNKLSRFNTEDKKLLESNATAYLRLVFK